MQHLFQIDYYFKRKTWSRNFQKKNSSKEIDFITHDCMTLNVHLLFCVFLYVFFSFLLLFFLSLFDVINQIKAHTNTHTYNLKSKKKKWIFIEFEQKCIVFM